MKFNQSTVAVSNQRIAACLRCVFSNCTEVAGIDFWVETFKAKLGCPGKTAAACESHPSCLSTGQGSCREQRSTYFATNFLLPATCPLKNFWKKKDECYRATYEGTPSSCMSLGCRVLDQYRCVRGADNPGKYVIVHNGTGVSQNYSRRSSQLTTLEKGTVVKVVEVREVAREQRIRGRIEIPQGWVSLEDTSDSYRWALPQEAAAQQTFFCDSAWANISNAVQHITSNEAAASWSVAVRNQNRCRAFTSQETCDLAPTTSIPWASMPATSFAQVSTAMRRRRFPIYVCGLVIASYFTLGYAK